MRRSSLFWGLALLIIGAVLLLSNLGLLPVVGWSLVWPILIVLLGGFTLLSAFQRPAEMEVQHATIELPSTPRANVQLNFGAGHLEVGALTRNDELLEGDFVGGVDIQKQEQGDVSNVRLRLPDQEWTRFMLPWAWNGKQPMEWRLNLNPNLPMALDIETGANEANINLRDVHVTDLKLKTGASSTLVQMPANAGETHATIEAGMASVNIFVPEHVAARIEAEGGLGSVDVNTQRFTREDGHGRNETNGLSIAGLYESADYAQAVNRLDLRVKVGVGSVKID